MSEFKILPVSDSAKWIGVPDRDIVTFDIVMETKYGTTYNSYFIDDEKKVIIDTVKETFWDIYLEKIKSVCDPAHIDYIIVNHTEPDHSGSLRHLLKLAANATVYGSRQAIAYLWEMVDAPFKYQVVKDGDELNIGKQTLQFISAPNLHWPDTIYTYLKEEKLLFTCDSFGAHYCDDRMYDDLVDDYSEAFKYYFDVILKPFSKFMIKAIEKIRPMEIKCICPGHGPILRSTWKEIVQKSENYSELYLAECDGADTNILITYVSAYGYTRQMAEKIAEGINQVSTANVHLVDIENMPLGEIEELIVKSKGIMVGSPTINQNTLMPVYKMFALINPIRDKGKKATTFGSYGWSGEAAKLIANHLSALKLDVCLDGLASKFMPHNEKADEFIEFGKRFAQKVE
ncbi:MAG: MBL fold metallo-hydrolase [Bacteroidetes bacterium]|jgi:flavorubredoxin|nr:MBL fold metallo-hydrolase [Bacteroidota bacterium]